MKDGYSCALFECRYDVLNKITVQSSLHPGTTYEIELLQKSSAATQEDKDLDIYDRA